MIRDATTPRPGAAKGVVPKKGIGIAFWMAGVPGRADMVKVSAKRDRCRHQAARDVGGPEQRLAIGASTKKATNRLTPP